MSQAWIQFINTWVVSAGLMLVMFSIGLTLALRDFALVARQPKLVGAGFIVASGLYTAHRERVRHSQLLQAVGESSPNA